MRPCGGLVLHFEWAVANRVFVGGSREFIFVMAICTNLRGWRDPLPTGGCSVGGVGTWKFTYCDWMDCTKLLVQTFMMAKHDILMTSAYCQ